MVRFLRPIGRILGWGGAPPTASQRTFSLHSGFPRVVFTIGGGQQVTIRVGSDSYSIYNALGGIMVTKNRPMGRPLMLAEGDGYFSTKRNEDFKVDDLRVSRRGKQLTVDIFGRRMDLAARLSTPPPDPEDTVTSAPLGLDGNPIDAAHYRELRDVERLEHGDVLPGHRFKLGDLSTYSRELLIVNTSESSALHPVLVTARRIGQDMASRPPLEIAQAVAHLVDEEFSPARNDGQDGEAMTIGYFVEKGGWCRHRAAALQVALQEAGVRSRYVRGKYKSGYHAWVEIDASGDGSFAYFIDPMRNRSGYVGERSKNYLRQSEGATVWRPL